MERLVIDTDPGVDDAQAILMAAAHPDATIEALLTVGGNVGLEHTTRNACRILEIAGLDVAVHEGCGRGLVRTAEDAAFVHGIDGLGDVGELPGATVTTSPHAAVALLGLVDASPGELTLVTLGPLTNIAVAVSLDPTLPTRLKRTVSMLGAVTGRGNTSTVTAEFNAHADPEAAHVVFEAWERAGCLIELVDWEATVRHPIPAATVDAWDELPTERARFNRRIIAAKRTTLARLLGHRDLVAADPLAMAVALEPDGVRTAARHHATVEIDGRSTRGQTVIDWMDRHGRPANVEVLLDYDTDRFIGLLGRAFS